MGGKNKTMSLELIKKLRDLTGAPMNDIKAALDQASGDEQKAIDILRLSGEKMAAKKATRTTKEGNIAMVINGSRGVLTAVACETDFVSRNVDFKTMVNGVGQAVADLNKVVTAEEASTIDSIKVLVEDIVAKMGENTMIKEIVELNIPGSVIAGYVHTNGKIGALVAIKGEEGKAQEVAKDIAMHLAAMRPAYIKPEDVPTEVLEHEKGIYKQLLLDEGKPVEMLDKIIEGKIKKFYSDSCLLEQALIKDDKQTVGNYIKSNGCEYLGSVASSL